MRVKILNEIFKCSEQEKPCFLNMLAKKLDSSHVAVKKHLDLIIEEGYVTELNPGGKPVYLQLSEKGLDVLREFKK